MKKVSFLCMIVLGVFFTACDTDEEPWGDWAKSNTYPGDNRVLAVSFQYGDNVYVGMGYNGALSTTDKYLSNFYRFDGTDWESVAGKFPDPKGGREGCVAFVIGTTAYVGAGYREKQREVSDTYFSDFYMFNLEDETWIKEDDGITYKKTDIVRDSDPLNLITGDDSVSSQFWSGIGFELGDKGYVGTGNVDGRISKSMFCYNPASGKWSTEAMPGDPRAGGVVFKIGETAVVCLGITDGSKPNVGVLTFDETNGWVEKAPLVDKSGDWNNNYNEIPRSYGIAFTSDYHEKMHGYIAGGNSSTAWRYDLEIDRWREVEEFSMAMAPRVGGVGFSIGGIGYLTTGGSSIRAANNNSTWLYIPGVDEDYNNDYP